MNNVKNLVILLLSVIVIVQAGILLYVFNSKQAHIKRPVAARKEAGPPAQKKKVAEQQKQEVPVRQVPEEITVPQVSGKIALVLDDWGYNLKSADFITGNKYHFTLSVLPFREYSRQIAELAYENGKEVIIHMPMEPHNKEQYGLEENTLLTTMPAQKVKELLDEAFAFVPHARGISNHMGSKATEDSRLMKVVLGYLKDRGMFFLDSMVTAKSAGRQISSAMRVGFSSRDVFIDNEEDPAYIRQQLVSLAKIAKKKGFAVGVGHDRPNTIAVLKEMIPVLQEQGFEFVNISDVISSRKKEGR